MNLENINNFKPNGLRVSTTERSELFDLGYGWCSNCEKVVEVSKMTSNNSKQFGIGSICRQCDKEKSVVRRKQTKAKLATLDGMDRESILEAKRVKERAYRRVKRQERIDSLPEIYFEDKYSFEPTGKKVTNRERRYLNENSIGWCSKCNLSKDLTDFSKGTVTCKTCVENYRSLNRVKINNQAKDYYSSNKEEKLIKAADYRKNNSKKVKESKKRYYEANKDRIAKHQKQFRLDNLERYKNKNREYNLNNKEKIARCSKEWRKYNLEHSRKYVKNRYHNDEQFKLKTICRQLVRRAYLSIGTKKENNTREFLGYSAIDLKEHIEKQFIKGMSWENYGDWEIDHSTPISLATTLEEGIKLSQLDNLQPLWKEDNQKKSNKLI